MIAADYYTHQPTDTILAVVGIAFVFVLVGSYFTDPKRRKR